MTSIVSLKRGRALGFPYLVEFHKAAHRSQNIYCHSVNSKLPNHFIRNLPATISTYKHLSNGTIVSWLDDYQ